MSAESRRPTLCGRKSRKADVPDFSKTTLTTIGYAPAEKVWLGAAGDSVSRQIDTMTKAGS
jgi:hypothetical protein